MPDTIIAKNTDSELQSIRASIAGKKGQIPFLLLPVRIEAKFMKVDKPLGRLPDGKLEQLLEQLAELILVLEKPLPTLSADRLNNYFNPIINQIKKATTASVQLKSINRQQKNWLRELSAELGVASRSALNELSHTAGEDLYKKLEAQTARLQKTIESRQAIEETAFGPAKAYLGELKALVQKVENCLEGKTPYTKPKNKKDLYGYLEKLQQELEHFYRPSDDKMESIQRIKNNQLSQIETLHHRLQQLVAKLPSAVAGLKDDKAWKSFVQLLHKQLPDRLEKGILHFEWVVLPKLQYAAGFKYIAASEIFYNSLRTLMEVERFNIPTSAKEFSSLQKSRKKLQSNIAALQQMGQKTIEGSEDQLEVISQLWKRMDRAVNNYAEILQKNRPSRTSHIFGWKIAEQFIRSEVKPIINSLSKTRLGAQAVLPSSTYKEGRRFFLHIEQELYDLMQNKPGDVDEKVGGIQKSIQQLANQFRIAERKTLPVTLAQHQAITAGLQKLQKQTIEWGLGEDAEIKQSFEIIRKGLTLGSLITDQPGLGISTRPVLVATPTQQQNELWVRIFPDDIHVHTHEEALTRNEIHDGQYYWKAWWAATNDHELEVGAWRALELSHGSQRAAWIARRLDPRRLRSNRLLLEDKPGKKIQMVTQAFQSTCRLLNGINPDLKGGAIFAAFEPVALAQSIHTISRQLEGLSFDQAAFMQRAYQELSRLESKLLILQNALNESPAEILAAHQPQLADIQVAFQFYSEVQRAFQSIEPLDTLHYLERLDSSLRFPNVQQKEKEWSEAPHSRVLPARFAIITINKGRYHHIAVGKPIPEKLQLGLDPSLFNFTNETDNPFQLDEEGNLRVDEGMSWMVDFETAIQCGMGIKIPLSQEEAEQGFDRVLVIGLHDADEEKGQQLLEELINNHHYSPEGMSLLDIGTPTNNTSSGAAGFRSQHSDPEANYKLEMGSNLFDASENDQLAMADGKRLADAMGVNPSVFQHLGKSDGQQISRAYAIHRALWHATVGDYMESGWDYVFTYDNIERSYQFFKDNVVARGILPSIRIGAQPYGILPTTAFSKMQFHSTFNEGNLPHLTKAQVLNPTAAINNKLQWRFDIRMKKLLLHLNSFWSVLRSSKVKHAYNIPKEANAGDLDTLPTPQQHFMEMLGLQASSVAYFFRYGINIAYRGPDPEELGFKVNFEENAIYGPNLLKNLFGSQLEDGYFFKSFEFDDELFAVADAESQAALIANRVNAQFHKSSLFKSRYLDKHTNISGPIIDTQELSAMNTLEKNIGTGSKTSYIQWLLEGADSLYDILEQNNFELLPSNSMLFMLLRQSLLLAYREAALNCMQQEGFFSEPYRRLIGASDRFRLFHHPTKKFVYTSKWTLLFRDPKTFNGLEGIDFSMKEDGTPNLLYQHLHNGDRSLADFLLNKNNLFNTYPNRPILQAFRDRVDEIRQAIALLDGVPTQDLNQLLAEHMDLSSYRLDAWLLGFANRRLIEHRQEGRSKGIYLGAYGWLEDLRPGGVREEAVHLPTELQPADQSPVFTDMDSEGFIHAPSINQAIAAAVLRSGYTASRETIGDLENQMAVNLSSRRVRQALYLVEGINNGQSLGAVLGFQFEKGIHESYQLAELDRFIYDFRRKFPLVIPLEVTANEAEENPQMNVVDGYVLLQQIEAHIAENLADQDTDRSIAELLNAVPFDRWPEFLTSIVDDNLQAEDDRNLLLRTIIREIDRIADALDALGDLVISESVYQVVQGNHIRAAAVVEALAQGKALPEFHFINSPRRGVVVTHRAVMNLERLAANSATAPARWPSRLTPRAKAEPSLNNWLGSVLGPANRIICLAQHETANGSNPIEVSIHELGLQPIDLLYQLGFNAGEGSGELESKVAWHIQAVHTFQAEDKLTISFRDRAEGWTPDQKTIYEITPLIHQLREMLTNAKFVDALDMMIPEDQPDLNNPEQIVPDDLQLRIQAAETDFRTIVANARAFIQSDFAELALESTTFNASQLDRLRGFLFDLAAYGLPGSVPIPTLIHDDAFGRVMLQRLLAVLDTSTNRLKVFDTQKTQLAQATTPRRQAELLISMGRQLFGKSMLLLPHYQIKNKTAISQQLSLPQANSLIRHRTDPYVLTDWLQGLADLRPGLYALDMGCMLAQAYGNSFPDWKPVQFPYKADDYWLGLEYPETFNPEDDFLSLCLFNHEELTRIGDLKVGFIIDEWTEIIPRKEEVTGITFHYDQPDAQAPQNLLLAVNPELSTNWNWDNLVHTLNETLDLAKNRAVEPDHIDESLFAQVMPMAISEVAPPQLRDYDEDDGATDKPFSNPLGTQVVMDFADNLPKKEEEDA